MKNQFLAYSIRNFRKILFWSIPITTAYLCYDTFLRMQDKSIFRDPFPIQMFHVGKLTLPYIVERFLRDGLRNLETTLDSGFIDTDILKPKSKSTYTLGMIMAEAFTLEGLKHVYAMLTGDNKKLIEKYSGLLKQHPNSPLLNASLAQLFAKEKDPKRAYSYLKRGLRLLIEVDDELIALGARIDKEDFYIDAFLTRKDDLKLFYHGFKLFSDEAEDGITGIKKLVDENPGNVRLNLEYAIFLDYLIGTKTKIKVEWLDKRLDQWNKCVQLVMNDPSTKIEPLGESQNEVRKIEDEFVLKNNINRDGLEKERSLAIRVNEILRVNWNNISSHMFFDVVEPRFLSDDPISGKHVYVMRFDSGKTLMDLIEDGSEITGIFDGMVEYTALLHATMPNTGKKLDVKAKTEDRLIKLQDELPDRVRKLFGENFGPFYETVDRFEQVWNSDGHPEQWMIDDNRITRLDTEDRGLVPYPMDLVNLGEYVRNENLRSLRGRMLTEYPKHFAKFTGRKLDGDLELGYLSSVGPRLISMFSALSSGNRPRMRERRRGLILNSIDSIGELKEKYPEVYRKNQKSFDEVQQGFSEMLVVV